jgi:hypothetical protein
MSAPFCGFFLEADRLKKRRDTSIRSRRGAKRIERRRVHPRARAAQPGAKSPQRLSAQ